jgi:hypothetical protein
MCEPQVTELFQGFENISWIVLVAGVFKVQWSIWKTGGSSVSYRGKKMEYLQVINQPIQATYKLLSYVLIPMLETELQIASKEI